MKRILKSRTLWGWIGLIVLVVLISFAIEGYGSWRAESHKEKACNALYQVGNYLREDMTWGDGLDSTTPSIRTKLDFASLESLLASEADPLHFRIFAEAVDLFTLSLEGDENGAIFSPYNIYNYTIFPICTNFQYMGNV